MALDDFRGERFLPLLGKGQVFRKAFAAFGLDRFALEDSFGKWQNLCLRPLNSGCFHGGTLESGLRPGCFPSGQLGAQGRSLILLRLGAGLSDLETDDFLGNTFKGDFKGLVLFFLDHLQQQALHLVPVHPEPGKYMEQQCNQETYGENSWRENVASEEQEKQPTYQQGQQQAEQPSRGISNEPGKPVNNPCKAQVRTIALGNMANLTRKSEEDVGLAACIIA